MAIQVQNKSAKTNAILDTITCNEGNRCDSVQCYFLTKIPCILNWSDAYQTDPDTSSILLHIQLNKNKWAASDLDTIHTGYITALKERRIQIFKKN